MSTRFGFQARGPGQVPVLRVGSWTSHHFLARDYAGAEGVGVGPSSRRGSAWGALQPAWPAETLEGAGPQGRLCPLRSHLLSWDGVGRAPAWGGPIPAGPLFTNFSGLQMPQGWVCAQGSHWGLTLLSGCPCTWSQEGRRAEVAPGPKKAGLYGAPALWARRGLITPSCGQNADPHQAPVPTLSVPPIPPCSHCHPHFTA